MSNVSHNETMVSWKNFLEKLIDDFKDKGYIFNHIAEMHIITIANKKMTLGERRSHESPWTLRYPGA